MKKGLLLVLSLFMSIVGYAYDAEVDGIYYDLNTSDKTARVTYKTNGYKSYSGNLIIPDKIVYDGDDYTITSIGTEAFYGCTRLTSIVIPNTITRIGESAFKSCTNLSSIIIPNSVLFIELEVFWNCSSLRSITIGNSVRSIGDYAFSGCNSLTSIHISDIAAWCNISFSNSDSNPLIYGHQLFLNDKIVDDLVIPDGVTNIKKNAFRSCYSLTTVTIPNSVTNIEHNSFSFCENLTSVSIPNSVTRIGESAFRRCKGLSSIIIPSSLTYFENTTFADCNLTSIRVDTGNPVYDSRDNCNAIIETGTNQLVLGCKSTIIPNSVTSIGVRAFSECNELTSIIIPSSVTSIEFGAFRSCKNLASIVIPSSVTSIDYSSFNECSKLTSITVDKENPVYDSRDNCNAIIETSTNNLIAGCQTTNIPNSVTSIGSNAFYGCSNLTTIIIPNSVTSIGFNAFYGCSMLSAINIPNSVTNIEIGSFYQCTNLTTINIPNSVTSIKGSTFGNCTNLTTIEIPNSVTSIETSAFNGCFNLTSIIIPNSVIKIQMLAFMDCRNLSSIVIGKSIEYIGVRAFAKCGNLKDVYCYAENVPSTETVSFENSNTRNATLYVPANSLNAYKTTAPWSEFGTILPLPEETGIDSSWENDKVKEAGRYTLDGIKTNLSNVGLNIIRMSNGKTKKVVVK